MNKVIDHQDDKRKKIVFINYSNYGSTGKIVKGISQLCEKNNMQPYVFVSNTRQNRLIRDSNCYFIGFKFSHLLHAKLSYFTGLNGCFQLLSTVVLVKKLRKIKPDIINIHNLHNSYVNIDLLFKYIKKSEIKVVWTLHDCWAFTGHCTHFTSCECERWKSGCHNCPSFKDYPRSRVDKTALMWSKKRSWFTGVKDLTLVTPSQWLADLVKQSFLSSYPVKVINNGIDLTTFKPISSDFRTRYGIADDKYIVLGVSFGWDRRKGIDIFSQLATLLEEDKYQIVLVGVDDRIKESLPANIVSIKRTQNQRELAEIYSAADLFVNPTREENFPTVNIEAIACGTPVLTFRTGGSPEIIDERSGCVVRNNDVDNLILEIKKIEKERPFSQANILNRAKLFNQNDRFEEYVRLYRTEF